MTPDKTSKKLGKLVEMTRMDKGMSEYEFAQALDKNVCYVRKLEGGVLNPYLVELVNIVEAFDMTFCEFFSRFED